MIRRILWMALAGFAAFLFYYLSRFYDWQLWGRDGLFGIEELRSQGGLLARWLRGTDFAVFELVIWAMGVFLVLNLLQALFDRLGRGRDETEDP